MGEKKGVLFLAINKKRDTIQADESHACVAAVWPAGCEVRADAGVLDHEWDDAHWSDKFMYS